MTEDINAMFLEHLKAAFECLLLLPLWQMILYIALFTITDGGILLLLSAYWCVKTLFEKDENGEK